jgi:undecaprenyl-diphosphatase
VFKALTLIGTWGAVWLALGLLAAIVLRRPPAFLVVAAADAIAQGASEGIKAAVDRPRPHVRPLVTVPHTPSFPSGHAASSFACALVLTWLAPRLGAPLLALASLIAASRVYVGVHYPLDVLAGALLGLAVATALRLLGAVPPRSRRAPLPG